MAEDMLEHVSRSGLEIQEIEKQDLSGIVSFASGLLNLKWDIPNE